MLSRTVFVVAGEIGDQAKVSVIGIEDSTKAGVLRTALGNLSDGAFQKQSYSERTAVDVSPSDGSNTDYRGICYFQEVSTGAIKRITIPAIKAANVEAVPGRDGGERVTDACMATVKAALEAATGDSLISLYGVVVQGR